MFCCDFLQVQKSQKEIEVKYQTQIEALKKALEEIKSIPQDDPGIQ